MTKHHTDPDATPTSQDPFWNDDADWTPSTLERMSPRVTVGAGVTVARWWNSLLGGDAPAGRAHGEPAAGTRRTGAGGTASGSHHDSWHIEPRSRGANSGRLDPKIARIGGLIVAITVAVPLILGFTSPPDDDTLKTVEAAPTSTVAAITTVTIPVGGVAQREPSDSGQSDDTAPATAARSTGVQAAAATSASSSESSSDSETSTAAPSPSSSPSTSTGPACGNSYEITAGDYWIRIADAADVSLSDLLAVNDASTDTELMPGSSICLPVGASTPAPPTTAPPTTTAPRPTTTSRPTTTNPPATNSPTTTRPPTTASPQWSASDVEAIIRSVWPDDLEEQALTIAWRESNHQPGAYNGHCCYGLFQIYYSVHRSWLTAYGVNQASDLYDPWKNARAAYGLYQRSGGWSPWRMTAG